MAKKPVKKSGLVEAENPEKIKKTKIRVIGVGGGGGLVVSEIASRIKKASFVVANTDRQALKTVSRRAVRFQFGQNFTQGLGTGMVVELGEMAAQNEKEKIKKLLEGQDFCIIVACLGGGVGSGAAPIFANISKNLGNITYGIFTLPFKFEGEKKMEIAKNSLEKLKPKLNSFAIIPNERIFQIIDKTTPLKQALSAINKNLADSLEGLIETIYQPGLINIDFADLRTIFEKKGRLTYLNTIEVQGDSRAEEAIKKVIFNPLYPYSIKGAKGVLFNISGEKNLSLSEIDKISKTISELVNKEAKIIFGLSQSKIYQDKIKITLLATGCTTNIFPKKPKKKRRRKAVSKPTRVASKEVSLKKEQGSKSKKKLPKPKRKSPSKKSKPKKRKKSKQKKVKIKVSKEPEEVFRPENPSNSIQIRKNGLQIRKEAEEAEKEIEDQEKIWEPPAFLRKKENK